MKKPHFLAKIVVLDQKSLRFSESFFWLKTRKKTKNWPFFTLFYKNTKF